MIRAATVEDFDRMIALGREMQRESWYGYLPYDEGKLREVLAHLLEHGFVMVHEDDGKIDGYFLGAISELWFCRELCAYDLALFVSADRRGGSAGYRMIRAFINWANARGVAEISLGVSTDVQKEATGKLYEAIGCRNVGGIYKLRGAQCAKA